MVINNLPEEELLAPGHRACAGCGPALAMRLALKAAGKNTIVCHATGCMEVTTTPYPETAWKVPWIHVAFENAAAVASGVERALKKLNKTDINILAIGGDGGTFDIGLQALSGALERKHSFVYLCYDNGAYMNTGIQRSGATPKFASTTTSPAGKKIPGKLENKKNLPFIAASHGAYVATANIAFPQDFVNKLKKAFSKKVPSYIEVYAPCQLGWKYPMNETIDIAKLAVQSKANILYEIEDGKLINLKKVDSPKPIKEFLLKQGRFKHLSEEQIAEWQKYVDEQYNRLVKIEESGVQLP